MSGLVEEDDVSLPSDSEDEENVEQTAEEEKVTDLSDTKVVTKYLEAARIANLALSTVAVQCTEGRPILELIQIGEQIITKSLDKIYNKKEDGEVVKKGIAFPVCVSVNERICNYSPLTSEADSCPPLSAGDMVKIDLGCHIDGYIACAAHTLIVGSAPALPAPECGDVAKACHDAMLVAAATIKPGAKNTDVTAAIARVAEAYGVKFIATVRSHQMKQFVIDGSKEIALCPPDVEAGEERVQEQEFEANEVYCIDVAMSTGEGKGREGEDRTTVYKRNVDVNYRLKMKASKEVLNAINKVHETMPFSLRTLCDERTAKMGITECVNHKLVTAYPVFNERADAYVAHFKTTVLLMPSGTTKKVTGLGCPEYFVSEKALDDENAALLKEVEDAEAKRKAKAAKKKKKK